MSKPGSALTFTYDADGNRITKTVNGVTTSYTYVDGRVTHETNGTDTIHYRYDTNGTLLSMNLNGTEYYYLYNGQRDVIGLYNASGNVVVEYTYDAWGRPLTTTGSLAGTVGTKNPYRYRSYRYDAESELYALQTRYYNPKVGKFICADSIFDGTNRPNGVNMQAYCRNRPVIMLDGSGCDAILLYEAPNRSSWGGHIGALVEDETGGWWYFYWGPNAFPLFQPNLIGVPVETYCIEYDGGTDIDSINQYSRRTFTENIYMNGDFTESLDEMKSADGIYNLWVNNCSQVTTNILSKSDTQYQKTLKTASYILHPSQTYKYVSQKATVIEKANRNASKSSRVTSPGGHIMPQFAGTKVRRELR